jgi:signal transduction histidine kinase
MLDYESGDATVLAAQVSRGEPIVPPGSSFSLEMFRDVESTMEAFEQGESQVVEDLRAIPQSSPVIQALQAKGIRSVLVVPLRIHEALIGIVAVGANSPNAFAPEDLDIANEVADSLAVAIQNARALESECTARMEAETLRDTLEHRVAERTRELTTLYEVTAATSQSLDLQETLEKCIEQTLRALRSSAAAVHVLDEPVEELRLAVQWGIPPDIVARLGTLSVEGGLMDSIREHGEPLVVPDIPKDPRTSQVFGSTSFHKYVGAPMRARGRTMGLLSVFDKDESNQEFSLEDVALLASIADHMGVAVENDWLRRRAEQAAILEERERLARELHDAATQSLYSLTLFAEAAQDRVRDGDFSQASQVLHDVSTTANQALKEMRLMLYQWRPSLLREGGLVEALRYRLDAVEGRVGVEGRLLADRSLKFSAPVEEGLYRIAQEALNNALRHADASTATVHIRTEGECVVLEVLDDGRGFDPHVAGQQGGLGLNSMRERAAELGGSLTISSAPGKGTRVEARVRLDS